MATCDYCDAHVSRQFRSVFADPDGRILACPNCSSTTGIAETTRERMRSARSGG
ncbi:DUF7563 family protein [Halomarina litorea]|uniref:DUF7563 family protein n=1 Tax=Halomarina litorea TaxID=2961595 RepID=UPI0020C4870E|nr:hypothetical protein [Halomarina sp. BCD28]